MGSKCQSNFRKETETKAKERVTQKYTQLQEKVWLLHTHTHTRFHSRVISARQLCNSTSLHNHHPPHSLPKFPLRLHRLAAERLHLSVPSQIPTSFASRFPPSVTVTQSHTAVHILVLVFLLSIFLLFIFYHINLHLHFQIVSISSLYNLTLYLPLSYVSL